MIRRSIAYMATYQIRRDGEVIGDVHEVTWIGACYLAQVKFGLTEEDNWTIEHIGEYDEEAADEQASA